MEEGGRWVRSRCGSHVFSNPANCPPAALAVAPIVEILAVVLVVALAEAPPLVALVVVALVVVLVVVPLDPTQLTALLLQC